MRARFRTFVSVLALALLATSAQAIPVLQIYVEGATYDPNTETWVTSQSDFKLWVVGDVDAFGPIQGATLTASFFGLGGSISFAPGTTALITDPSVPAGLALAGSGTGGHPVLPPHGIFNDATLHHWEDWAMGDMSLTDSPIGDYNGSPAWPVSFPDNGQVNVYDVHVEGWTKVHFDAYGTTVDTTDGKATTWKTPGSHDGQVPVQNETWDRVKAMYRD
jgi:hypothetical protein